MEHQFSSPRFFDDIRSTAALLDAPFSADTTRVVLDVYADNFRDGAIVWKTTAKPGDALCYRFFARTRDDTIGAAVTAGLVRPDQPSTALIRDWSRWFDTEAIESCDFDAGTGLAKTWLHLGGMRPVDDVLGLAFVPDSIRRHRAEFQRVGFEYVRFVAVDHRSASANLYFRSLGPLTARRCADIVELVGAAPPPAHQFAEIQAKVPTDFCVAATVGLADGALRRLCFYALGLTPTSFPELPGRLGRFFAGAPSHDGTPMNVVGWSFGSRGGTYLKAERGYLGDMAGVLASWDCYLSGSTQRDPVLTEASVA
jgi:4-hydroxyphenylpyruvate 3-dimethylallyltransferase